MDSPDYYNRDMFCAMPILGSCSVSAVIPQRNVEEKNVRGDENKFDGGKPMWDLLPWNAVEAIVEVLTYGATKYRPNGWKAVENPVERYTAALFRHLVAWRKGEDIDPESNHSHLAHALTNLVFLYELELAERERQLKEI